MWLAIAALLVSSPARAQPAHCERPLERASWPVIGDAEDAPATAIAPREARALVSKFRRTFARLPGRSDVLRAFTACMLSSHEHFMVRRVATSIARARIEALAREGLGASILSGDASALGGDWVYEVYWGGASRRFRPSGAVSGFLSADGRTVAVTVHWPEG
jgi:hypothetical protein